LKNDEMPMPITRCPVINASTCLPQADVPAVNTLGDFGAIDVPIGNDPNPHTAIENKRVANTCDEIEDR
jgi:hypothetical protein